MAMLGSFADVREAILGHAGFEITVTGGDHGVVFGAKEMLCIEIDENTTMVGRYIMVKRSIVNYENGGFNGRGNKNMVDPFEAS
jgi:hypothetical protein